MVQTRPLRFTSGTNVKALTQSKTAELKHLDALATIAVMNHDVIAMVAAKDDDMNNISEPGQWNPKLQVIAASTRAVQGYGQPAPQSQSKKALLRRLIFIPNTRRDDARTKRYIPPDNTPTLVNSEPPEGIPNPDPDESPNLDTYLDACWWVHYKSLLY